MGTPSPSGAVHNDDHLREPIFVQSGLTEENGASQSNPKPSEVAPDSRHGAAFSESGIAEELRVLRAKISELETGNQARTGDFKDPQNSPE